LYPQTGYNRNSTTFVDIEWVVHFISAFRTLHHNTPYPSVTVTVYIILTSVLPPLFAYAFPGSLRVVQMCLNVNILYVRYVLLVITAWLKVCDVLKACLFCSCTSVWLYSRIGIYIYMQ